VTLTFHVRFAARRLLRPQPSQTVHPVVAVLAGSHRLRLIVLLLIAPCVEVTVARSPSHNTDLPQSRGIHAAVAFVLGATCAGLLKSSLVPTSSASFTAATANLPVRRPQWMEKSMSSVKDVMVDIITQQPEDSSYDEILRELAYARMVQRGLADSENGRTLSDSEVRERIESWQK
jgi:predicted transcriptional regulator